MRSKNIKTKRAVPRQRGRVDYKKAGVDIDSADALVDKIALFAKKTNRAEVMAGIGGFAGLFSLSHSQVQNPVLVASTDGVGTKLKIAVDLKKYDTIGQDLVAMCVNDLICCGAEPLFFLDYFATGKLKVSQAQAIIQSIATSLQDIHCALLGGETAEMPGLYRGDDFDIAGFAVGLVDKNKIIEGANVGLGDHVIGLPSSGMHSNGYSLARKIIQKRRLSWNKKLSFAPKGLGLELLKPTCVYVNPVLALLKQFDIHAMAHITGGGIEGNLPRVLPQTCKAVIERAQIQTPEIFRYLQNEGNVPEAEMWRVFNMGIGYILVVKPSESAAVINQLRSFKIRAVTLGTIENKKPKEIGVTFI